jgi:hypothetical protein
MRIASPDWPSQSRTVKSADLDASILPSGEKHKAKTGFL